MVWVGFDDYTDLGLEGARSALPIWTEFMSEAARYKQYGDAKAFQPPAGVTQVSVDPQTGPVVRPWLHQRNVRATSLTARNRKRLARPNRSKLSQPVKVA